ncbi:Hypothetical predicted protein [Olea europaea subsp. europaea]|uniref:Fatty acyl-CoA reductase C-terminal domain-containing protein n=1 Tax=Olea europaea subsp. europaea TaxID=158383 RepID=A0A8S0UPF0_OLEEU|nr:Hypothetical predicted protein [Olea europaea subsp. europaea]
MSSFFTAYVQGLSVGLIPEKPFHMGETLDGAKISYFDIDTEKRMVEERLRGPEAQNAAEPEIASAMRNLGIDRVFKVGCWQLSFFLFANLKLNASSFAYGKGKLKFFVGDPNSTLDMIRGDMMVNSMLVAMAMHTNQPSHSFDDTTAENLRTTIRGSEVFNFDPKCIQWDEYFMNTHFPGVTKYALK